MAQNTVLSPIPVAEEQIETLTDFFPNLIYGKYYNPHESAINLNAHGIFVIPHIRNLGNNFYSACKNVLQALISKYGPDVITPGAHAALEHLYPQELLQTGNASYESDNCIFYGLPINLGDFYSDRIPTELTRDLNTRFGNTLFPLGFYELGIAVLSYQDTIPNDAVILCPGTTFESGGRIYTLGFKWTEEGDPNIDVYYADECFGAHIPVGYMYGMK